MAPRLRRMKAYHPRRKRVKNLSLNKQALIDIEHKISIELGALVISFEQGNLTQTEAAKIKLKSAFQKHADEMKKLAEDMGHKYPQFVADFLDSVDTILHCNPNFIDPAKISHCYNMTHRLEAELKAA